ncbi:MAG: CHAT domain-containing protein [Gammaproteobacteria bacterium]|nr:CHAT domain-containing protein [Gammaproteobacteria bacterium]
MTILLLSANPLDTERLRLDAEAREIDEGLRRAKKSDDFHIKTSPAATPADIRRALLDHSPAIVHFSGHGKGEDGLVFDDGQGNSQRVNSEALAALFGLFAADVKCVLLNACYSEVQARSIARHIDYVIGMNREISDKAALAFAVAFYDAVGAGREIEFAYRSACVELQLQNIPEHLTPILIQRRHAAVSTAPSQTSVESVFLAEVPDDLSALRKQVQTALEQANVRVLPKEPYYFPDAAGLQAQLDADLQQSRLFVQLLNATNPQRPPGMSTPPLQAERARAMGLPSLHWHERGLDRAQADPALQTLLQQAETGDFQIFINKLRQRLQALQNRKPAEENTDLFVFLNAAQEDAALLQDIKPQLEARQITYEEPLLLLQPDAEPSDVRVDLDGNLCDCQAVLLLYCNASLLWLRAQLRRCHSALRKREEPLQVMMMCRCAEGPKHADLDKKYPKLRIVDCRPPFSDSCLSRFLEALGLETSHE